MMRGTAKLVPTFAGALPSAFSGGNDGRTSSGRQGATSPAACEVGSTAEVSTRRQLGHRIEDGAELGAHQRLLLGGEREPGQAGHVPDLFQGERHGQSFLKMFSSALTTACRCSGDRSCFSKWASSPASIHRPLQLKHMSRSTSPRFRVCRSKPHFGHFM